VEFWFAEGFVAELFLSYNRQDKPIAEAMAVEFQRLGVDVWWDHDLLGGDDYRRRIEQVLARASAAIVVWSRRSVDSQWVIGEAALARDRKILIPVTIDTCQPHLDFRALHTTDLCGWVPGDQLPEPVLLAVSNHLDRELSYKGDRPKGAGYLRGAAAATQAWYADMESLLFYLIGQGFACALVNIPLAVYTSKPQSTMHSLPQWVPFAVAALNGMIVAVLQMRTAVSGRRMSSALPLLALASGLSIPAYLLTKFLHETVPDAFMTVVGFWALALLFVTDIAKRAAESQR
jgi:hypothetical protein